jgi:hypothetical protein
MMWLASRAALECLEYRAGEMATQAPVAALGLKFAGRGRHGWIAVC